jgi:acid phosphatase type 7
MRRRVRISPAVGALVGAVALAAGWLAGCGDGQTREDSVVLLAAGDIAECDAQGDEATARLLNAYPKATIAALGDLAYPHGRDEDFARCFDPSWGQFKDRIRPATGNHDHATKDARGYAKYFGSRGGPVDRYYYSYELGDWHVAVLDSDCWRVGGCGPNDPQATWLRRDLRDHPARCMLAYWHRPPFSSGRYGDPANTDRVRPLWRVAVDEGVDVVLTAHEHSYERFVPMDADGGRDDEGTRLFVVGTGGGNLREYHRPPLPTTAVRNDDTWGVLRLTLRAGGYDWKFLPVPGRSFTDSGTGSCH